MVAPVSSRTRPTLRSLALAAWAAVALVPTSSARAAELALDRTAVRFVTPETGGGAKPRFVTQRQLAFFARAEAIMEGLSLEPGEYPERYVRLATDRLVARAMLASLMKQRGLEPPDLPKLALEARTDLADRLGGAAALADLMRGEGLEDEELAAFLRDQVRAIWYVDKGITPILSVTDDALRESYRAGSHPYKSLRFEDARQGLKRWLVSERARVAEMEFLQGARTRIKVTVLQ